MELSIIIKTFQRPECLRNILTSINKYSNYNNTDFSNVIVVDDSSQEIQDINTKLINNLKIKNLKHIKTEFNISLSKGRTIALDYVNSDNILLCDDDFILDSSCDLNSIIDKEMKYVDILGGYLTNLEESGAYINKFLGVGYFKSIYKTLFLKAWYPEDDDIYNYNNENPNFLINFYIGKTEVIKKIKWIDLDHLGFFHDAWKNNVKMKISTNLFAFHKQIKSNGYMTYRNDRDKLLLDIKNFMYRSNLNKMYIQDSNVFYEYTPKNGIIEKKPIKNKLKKKIIKIIFKRVIPGKKKS